MKIHVLGSCLNSISEKPSVTNINPGHLESQLQAVKAQSFFAGDGPEASEVFVNCVTMVWVNQGIEREGIRTGDFLLHTFGATLLGEPIIFLIKILNVKNLEKQIGNLFVRGRVLSAGQVSRKPRLIFQLPLLKMYRYLIIVIDILILISRLESPCQFSSQVDSDESFFVLSCIFRQSFLDDPVVTTIAIGPIAQLCGNTVYIF